MRPCLSISISLALAAGCVSTTITTTTGDSSAASSGSGVGSTAAATSTSTSTSTSSASAAGSSTGSSTGSGSSSTGGSSAASTSSSGTTTGLPPVYIDGGYVFCEATLTLDGGSPADVAWECNPGTYFCASDGTEACTQCLTDADCANEDLPTFDPERPHCDLASRVAGYRGFCQQCLTDFQCADRPGRPTCDANPGDVNPPIVTRGFETCIPTPLGCPYGQVLELGGCGQGGCSKDGDCAQAIAGGGLLLPFCVQGSCVSNPEGNSCPDCQCGFPGCGSLGSVPMVCGSNFLCACTKADQCGEAWPVCEIPDDEDAGMCGCDADAECGDGGLKCLPASASNPSGYCGVPCTDPRSPACGLMNPQKPVCDVISGACSGCGSDNDCQKHAAGPTVAPFCRLDGICGCRNNADCPEGLTCQNIDTESRSDGLLGQCAVPPSCGPGTCGSGHCDPDSGACNGCITDEDCWSAHPRGEFRCDQSIGNCVECRDDLDCVFGGANYQTYCDPSSHTCSSACGNDADCSGNAAGAHCLGNRCGCAADDECTGNVYGSRCATDAGDEAFGYCHCLDTSDCPSGLACAPEISEYCIAGCGYGNACAPGLYCDSLYNCRPQCGSDGGGCPASAPLCDLENVAGQNLDGGEDGGEVAIWCYGCLSEADCPAGDACAYDHTCQLCYSGTCASGEECLVDGHCHPTCDAGSCPTGQFCGVEPIQLPGVDVCEECLSPSDCPNGEGCDSRYHICGSCHGPNAQTLSTGCSEYAPGCNSDCPPDAVCSNYWISNLDVDQIPLGVCLQNCDHVPCADGKTCEMLPELSLDHKYCFGCLSNADCADAGPGAYCDDVFGLTFTCLTAGG